MRLLKVARLALALVGMAMGPTQAEAAGAQGFGYITGIHTAINGAVLFSVSGSAKAGVPACATSPNYSWAIDGSTAAGQSQINMLISAWSQHVQVYVVGAGSCAVWGDAETVQYVIFIDQPY